MMKMTDEEAILKAMDVDFEAPAPGCCGMAGSFGFEADKYDDLDRHWRTRAFACGPPGFADCLIIADGFSCREQIAQCTGRHALHLAE